MMPGIEVKNVTKKFGHITALNNVSIMFNENKIYGLLGRNGAGKSTLINIISNRIFSTEGEIFIDGAPSMENDAELKKLYVMSEKTYYPESMRIKEIFKITKDFYPSFDVENAKKLSEIFGLDLKSRVKSLSTGYTSIFKIIVALSVNVPYLIFDEPILGLDANHRELFYKLLIEKYSETSCSVIISTHLIEEVSGIIEEVVIIDRGRVLKSESCEELLSGGYTVTGKSSEVDAFSIGKNVIGQDALGNLKSVYILGSFDGEIPEGLEVGKMDLQKLFVKLTSV